MAINILLIIAVFGLPKKKFNAFATAAIYGSLKGVTYFIASRNLLMALVAFAIGCTLGYTTRYLFERLDNYDTNGEVYSNYSTKKKWKFKWEYIPLTLLVIIMILAF